jgi:hypothetical protein
MLASLRGRRALLRCCCGRVARRNFSAVSRFRPGPAIDSDRGQPLSETGLAAVGSAAARHPSATSRTRLAASVAALSNNGWPRRGRLRRSSGMLTDRQAVGTLNGSVGSLHPWLEQPNEHSSQLFRNGVGSVCCGTHGGSFLDSPRQWRYLRLSNSRLYFQCQRRVHRTHTNGYRVPGHGDLHVRNDEHGVSMHQVTACGDFVAAVVAILN